MLKYVAKAEPGGKIAQLGGRLITSTARKLSKMFFTKFEKIMSGEESLPEEDDAGETTPSIQSRRDPLLAGLRPMKLCLTFKAPRGIQSQCLTEILPWCCVEQKPALEAPANVLAILWMVAAICTGVPAQDRGCLQNADSSH